MIISINNYLGVNLGNKQSQNRIRWGKAVIPPQFHIRGKFTQQQVSIYIVSDTSFPISSRTAASLDMG